MTSEDPPEAERDDGDADTPTGTGPAANGSGPDTAGDGAEGAPGDAKGSELGYSANLKPRPIEEELRTSFLDYSMSVIVSRAIPDVRDGLKPVQRRILYAMRDMGLGPNAPYRKSARVVGEVLGKYHPHGDSAVYDAMVRMAQDFSLRYQLVDGQGNFGSVDGDPAAAMRYTEARLAKIAHELLEDIDKDTVDFTGNFDDSLEEPTVVPARLPNLLVNGASGIAVGMATNIPPHNLTEICDAIIRMVDEPGVTVHDLMDIVKGPDFPTGGIIYGSSGIYSAYLSGRGRVTVRGRTEIEERGNDREAIIITELPYQVNKANLLVSIADLVKDKRIEGISDLRDESDRNGMRVVIELKKGTVADLVLNQLYSHTQLQNNFNVLNLSLVGGQPKVLDLRETLAEYLKHREVIVTRRTQYELRKAEEKLHILEGLIIALDNIDAVIELIRSSPDPETARAGLIERFSLSEAQAKAILDMRLSKLTSLEVDSVKKDHADTAAFVERCKEILADRREILKIIRDETLSLKDKFGDGRRTEIIEGEIDIDDEDLIPREDILVTLTRDGYIKRMSLDTYRAQNRGGKGLKGMRVKEEDQIIHLFKAHTHDWVLYFTDKGRVFKLKGYKVPAGTRQSKGKAIVNLLEGLQGDERIMTCIPLSDEAFHDEDRSMVFATRQGKVKRTAITAYRNILSSGIKAIKLEDGDQLLAVRLSGGDDVIMLATANGQACTFHGSTENLRPMGRDTTGVRGIKLRPGDEVVSLAVFHDIDLPIFERSDEEEEPEEGAEVAELAEEGEVEEGARPYKGGGPYVLSLTENGYGKVVHLANYRLTNRGGLGVRTLNVTKKSGKLVAVRGIDGDEHLLMSSVGGMVVRTPVPQIRLTKSRAATGVIVMRVGPSDRLQAVAVLPPESIEDAEDSSRLPPPDETPFVEDEIAEGAEREETP